jgi:putative glutamine amidotransferase
MGRHGTALKPRIGITSGRDGRDWVIDGSSWLPYAASIERAGGEPVHLDQRTLGREAEVLSGLRAIVFSGGKDIDLALYPNPPALDGEGAACVMEQFRMRPEPQRDKYELPLMSAALDRDLPILGICRGCQVLNVALGGRLILDIPQEVETEVPHASSPAPGGASSIHPVRIHDETLLASILKPALFPICNSRHHQAVRLDDSFTARVSAVSPDDGLVEAIEVPGRRWVIGVQWHPEHPQDAEIRTRCEPLFRAFVEAAG